MSLTMCVLSHVCSIIPVLTISVAVWPCNNPQLLLRYFVIPLLLAEKANAVDASGFALASVAREQQQPYIRAHSIAL